MKNIFTISSDEPIPKITLGKMLELSAQSFPDEIALIEGHKQITYSELLDKAKQFANFLENMGIDSEDIVATVLLNRISFAITFFGTMLIGAKLAIISPRLSTNELNIIINDSGASVMVTYSDICKRLSKGNITYPFQCRIIDMAENETLDEACKIQDYVLFNSIFQNRRANFEDKAQWNQIGVLLYTGGTTGTPKGVMLTHTNLITNALQFNYSLNIRASMKGEKVLAVLPLYHSFGLLCAFIAPLSYGGTVVLHSKFDPVKVLADIQDLQISRFYGVPTMYISLLRQKIEEFNLSSLKTCISGGAPLPVEVFNEFHERTGKYIIEGYGLTECSPVTHLNPPERPKPGSIGVPLVKTHAKIADPITEEELGIDEVGELLIKGPQVMKGYWKKAIETMNVFTKDGWLKTGDVAKKDADGYYYIVDRLKDVIISGGLKIYPREVEEQLYGHPAVKMVAVVGVPNGYYGEVAKALVVLKEGEKVTEEELKEFLREKIAKFKIPKSIEFVKELPLSPAGKILKKKIRERELGK